MRSRSGYLELEGSKARHPFSPRTGPPYPIRSCPTRANLKVSLPQI